MVAVTGEAIVTSGTDTNYSYPDIEFNLNQILCEFKHYYFNNTGLLHCPADWDDVKCWPPTRAGHIANESCPYWENHNSTAGIVRAYRICKEDGVWENLSDYNHCLNYTITPPTFPESYQHARTLSIIYLTFCCISLFLLVISLFIFYYFKSLQCTRVAIHKNLFVSFALKYIVFILVFYSTTDNDYFDYTGTSSSTSILQTPVVCRLSLILAQYFSMVNIFWMLNEGVFLTSRIAIAVFSTKSNLKMYFVVGWGCPVIFVVIWAVLMYLNYEDRCWLNYVESDLLNILSVPQFVAFLLNMIILINIIRILITKLRASHAVETNQVRKAVKATVVLLPLLGVALMLSFWQYPGEENYTYHFVFSVIVSTQGMFVAVIYCFLNTEVQMTVRRKLKRINVVKKTRGPRRLQASNPASFMVATSSEVVLPMSYRKKTTTSIDNPFWPEQSEVLKKQQNVQSNDKEIIDNNKNNIIYPNV